MRLDPPRLRLRLQTEVIAAAVATAAAAAVADWLRGCGEPTRGRVLITGVPDKEEEHRRHQQEVETHCVTMS